MNETIRCVKHVQMIRMGEEGVAVFRHMNKVKVVGGEEREKDNKEWFSQFAIVATRRE